MSHRKPIAVLLAVILFAALIACGETATSTTTSNTPTTTQASNVTPTPTHALKWTTTQTFHGNGTKKTAIFHTSDDWKILYTCAGFDSGVDGALAVTVYGSDNTIIDVAINASCKANSTSSGETEEHQGGDVYLSVDGTGDWSLKIQELK